MVVLLLLLLPSGVIFSPAWRLRCLSSLLLLLLLLMLSLLLSLLFDVLRGGEGDGEGGFEDDTPPSW